MRIISQAHLEITRSAQTRTAAFVWQELSSTLNSFLSPPPPTLGERRHHGAAVWQYLFFCSLKSLEFPRLPRAPWCLCWMEPLISSTIHFCCCPKEAANLRHSSWKFLEAPSLERGEDLSGFLSLTIGLAKTAWDRLTADTHLVPYFSVPLSSNFVDLCNREWTWEWQGADLSGSPAALLNTSVWLKGWHHLPICL